MTFSGQCVLIKQMSSIMAQPPGPAFPCLLGCCTQMTNPLPSPASFSMWRSFSVLWPYPMGPPTPLGVNRSASITGAKCKCPASWDGHMALLPSMQARSLHGGSHPKELYLTSVMDPYHCRSEGNGVVGDWLLEQWEWDLAHTLLHAQIIVQIWKLHLQNLLGFGLPCVYVTCALLFQIAPEGPTADWQEAAKTRCVISRWAVGSLRLSVLLVPGDEEVTKLKGCTTSLGK